MESFLEELHFMWVRATAGFEVAERFKINQADDSEVGVDMKAFALATKQVSVAIASCAKKRGGLSHQPGASPEEEQGSMRGDKWCS